MGHPNIYYRTTFTFIIEPNFWLKKVRQVSLTGWTCKKSLVTYSCGFLVSQWLVIGWM